MQAYGGPPPGRSAGPVVAIGCGVILSITAIGHQLSGILDGWNTFTVAVIVWAAWMTLVLTGVLVFRTVYREWEDWDLVADVAEIASWTGFGILSFSGVVQWLQILFTYD